MIIAEIKSTPVESNIGATPTRFKIKASARAFQILSGFYSDKIAAIPRELGANAWDSHVKAGTTDIPFEVHVPNALEPWFSIRDYGTGLSPEAVDSIYTTYFESTKTQSNDEDGCMGLGSKTPFNYTENFTVTVWHKEEKSTYNCFIDEGGGPSIIALNRQPSLEPSGLQVHFAVKQDDISTFIQKIRQAYLPFRVKPKLVGTHNIQFPVTTHTFKGNGWAMRSDSGDSYSYTSRGSSNALMGNYSYPIDSSVWGWNPCKGVTEEEITSARRILQNGKFDFQFNIGDLDVAPNKEQLQYDADDRTRSAILKRAAIAHTELNDQVMATIRPTTRWEAMKLYWTYNSHNSPVAQDVRRVLGTISIPFNGKNVEDSSIHVSTLSTEIVAAGGAPRADNSPHFSVRVASYSTLKNRMKMHESYNYRIQHKDRTIVLYTNQENLKKSRIRKYLEDTFPGETNYEFLLVMDMSANFQTMWDHQKFLGIPAACFVNIDTLPKPTIIRTGTGRTKSAVVNGVYGTSFAYITERDTPYVNFMVETLTADSSGTYYYVPLYYTSGFIGKVDDADKRTLSDDELASILKKAVEFGIVPNDKTVKTIYGVNKKIKNALKIGKWVNLVEAVVKKMKGKEMTKLEQALAAREHRNQVEDTSNKLCYLFRNYLGKPLLAGIHRKETRDLFTHIHTVTTNSSAKAIISGVDANIIKIFDIKAKKHADFEYDIAEIEKILGVKYMGIFDIIDTYKIDVKKLAAIINFIDENVKSS